VAARLDAPFPRDAAAGTRLKVSWTMATAEGPYADQGGILIRLRGGEGSTQAFAAPLSGGRYVAHVSVPAGVRDVQIGLQGTACDISGCRSSPMFFPIVNDPFPGPPPAASSGGDGGDESRLPWVVAALVLLGVAAASVPLLRRRTAPLRA